ncbi:AMP-binding enzyme family protein [Penicillium odoratum]|uniref:AMP-binding enzyme family protein n=1 Tax=Penicillium odoratum TaxID=1167516 RepID=UPI00254762CE|nr:AMP-binding enzyme family protein [Penicillium odoratum]KAJ5769006.1 AMP-binding enzyme family protein [Penicillium odoratum]
MILDLKNDLDKDYYPTTTSGKIQKAILREWVINYLDQVAAKKLEAKDILSELTACWSAVSGLPVEEIDQNRPIRSFTDSTMIIQFLHIAAQKGWTLTFKLLTVYTTICEQATFLSMMKLPPSLSVSESPVEKRSPLAWESDKGVHEDLVNTKLQALGLEWGDVESILPMTDYSSNFSRDRSRPTAWNFRFTWSVENSMSEAQLFSTLETWFKRHPLLRCTSVVCSEDLELVLVMRPHVQWLKHQILHAGEVQDMEAATKYRLNDPEYDYVNGTGPLFKIAILKTQNPTAHALVMHFHHALYDALSLIRWLQDLKQLLKNNGDSSLQFLPYKDFAEQYYEYRSSRSAEEAVDFHVSRLRGISSCKNAIWPPDASVSKDISFDVQEIAPKTMPVGAVDKSCGMQGTNCYLRLTQLAAMKSQFAISAPIIAMTACALVNVRQTKASEAIFNNLLSGRTWPLADNAQGGLTDNMLEVDGPTMTYTVSRIRIDGNETAFQLLQRVQNEQDQLAIYAHAPLNQINRRLKEMDTEKGASDVSLMDTIYRRQAFDWLLEQYSESETDAMKLVDDDSRSNLGFVWFPFIKDGNLLHLNVTFDHALLSSREVQKVTTEFMCAAAWLSDPANAYRPLSQCRFSGYEVAYQQPL